ncbi:Integral membrane protein [hydrothermal vent metagenome]|uniref:Integral membrane protein n=1 Tax=hydrothermal vent metagenome TaxID=652676 RepID=A0A3B1A0L6_9ZZZZ
MNITTLKYLLLSCRPKQWVKNVLLFVPLVLAHKIQDISLWIDSIYAFVAFTLVASSIYIINDLSDIQVDKLHPTKKNRPLASGKVKTVHAISLVSLLLLTSGLLVLVLPIKFQLAIIVYLVITTVYTFKLKLIALLDVITLSCLYTLRILSGIFAIDVEVSYWLISFSIFFFLSLAFVKRYIELKNLLDTGVKKIPGRGYSIVDIENIRSFGITSGYLSVLIFALYINDEALIKLYSAPYWLWGISLLLLYWISRMWFIANNKLKSDDPVLFAVQDKTSYVVLLLCVFCFTMAI